MKRSMGFSRFEFYVVLSVVSVVALFGIQRYSDIAKEAQRFGFEALAQNFSATVYNYRSRWILDQQRDKNVLEVDGSLVQFSMQGWPLAVLSNENVYAGVTLSSCASLWKTFLQNPPTLSYKGSQASGTATYHLVINSENLCRFERTVSESPGFYFEYSPVSGEVSIHTPR
jgi:hypothetical protein